ncbi:MAG: clostripain-related cysteine peptidase, partial [Candidatus Heimdallarchaeaceae archaeon]
LWDHGGGIDGLCWDSSSNDDFLTINELQEALAGYHFDFLGMDACIMGQYEIIYEMRTCADFVGVSLLNEPGDGWDYEHFLPYLLADPSLTGDELGTYVCQTYVDQYSSAVTFGIWNTTDMTRVQEEMENLTIVLLKNLETYSGEIGEARALATSNGYPNYGADLYEFIENLENSSSAVIVQQANKTLAALKDINIMSYSNLPEIPFGLWVYFPRIPNEDYNKFYFNSNETHVDFSSNPYYGLDFVLNSSWEEFINAWRDALPTALYNINDKEQLTVSTSTDEYFAIELFAGDKVDVKLEVGEPGGPELYLYNSLGQLVDSDDSITDPKEVEYITFENGSTYVGVIVKATDLNYTYKLSVDIDSRPYITNILVNPKSPGFGTDVQISCNIIDGNGLAEVILSYNSSTGWKNVSMTQDLDNQYVSSIAIDENIKCLLYKIYAKDTLGNSIAAGTKKIIFHETVLPEVTNIKLNPKHPKSGEEVTITFNVYDASGIDKIIFSYNLGNRWKNETLYEMEEGKGSITITLPEELSVLEFKVYAFDVWGNCLITERTIIELNVGPLSISPFIIFLSLVILSIIPLYKRKNNS